MSRDERERLQDIKDAIATIREHLARAGDTPSPEASALLHDALLFQFVVIGEAVKKDAQADAGQSGLQGPQAALR